MKSVEDIEKELLSTNIWKDMDLMSGFSVEEDVQDFKIEVISMRQDFPQKFNVARAVIMLKSLPWPDSISITRSEPLRFLTEWDLGISQIKEQARNSLTAPKLERSLTA